MPPDTGMAFVLVPHLDPSHKSLMTELLAKYTPLPVCEAGDGMTLQPDRVYIIPPNHYLSLDGPRLRLEAPPHAHGPQTAIDHFLRSLAEEWGELAVGILLSGTGSHGSLGLREIKGRGGLTLVQEPTEAAYGQMPRSAAADGSVDYILPVADMPEVLLRHARRLARGKGAREQAQEHGANGQLGQILALLRARTQYDFRCYRKRMLMRRVQRRMGLARLERLTDYLARLRDDAAEVNALFKDLLIGVTSFFREPDAFRLLEQRVLNTLVEHCDNDSPLRVWVPACSSGEEAYSIAMLLIESCERHNRPCAIQVFATDIDEDALAFARQGLYPAGIKADLSPARLNRFFGRSGDAHYQVSKQLRETVVFAAQNLVSDAPFSRLDLISCRNLMIYMEPEVQGKLIALFHFALKPEGFLFLGPSETISRQADLFETLSKKWRIFRRIGPPRRDLLEFPLGNGGARIAQPPQLQDAGGPAPLPDFGDLTRRLLLDAFAPATLLVNRRLEILYFHGPTVQYLELPTGAPTRDLIEMAREGLRTRLRAACHRALREKQPVRVVDARVKRDGVFHPVELSVTPVHEPKGAEGMLLVSFFERPPRAGDDAASGTDELLGDETAAIQQLEQELKTTREDLQSTIEEMESANEELKASNEEVMSMNEELQSANEELETSKEELQSLNEELSTVNNQLQDKVEELERTGNDIANLLANTELAVIFLDNQFRIKRFTPATARLLNLLESDIGRQLADFAPKFSDEFLLEDAGTVLRTLAATEKEVSNTAGQVYLRRIQPYRTADDRIEGVAVTLVEITRRKQMEAKLEELNRALMKDVDERTAELQRREREFRILADNVPTLFAYIDSRRRYRYVNRHYAELYGRSADELIGRPVKEVIGQ
jgi:two-component system CheB/CheR fusion protein